MLYEADTLLISIKRYVSHGPQWAELRRHLCVWDPFCGRGQLLLEALGLALGVPPASPARGPRGTGAESQSSGGSDPHILFAVPRW